MPKGLAEPVVCGQQKRGAFFIFTKESGQIKTLRGQELFFYIVLYGIFINTGESLGESQTSRRSWRLLHTMAKDQDYFPDKIE